MWHSRRVEFLYVSQTTFYRCTELATRLFAVMEALGTRSPKNVESHCGDFERQQALSFDVEIPVEATQAHLRSATTFDAKEQLLAHVQGHSLPSATDIVRFPAVWKTVSLMAIRRPSLQMQDCDLLRAVRSQILPLLSVRSAGHDMRCTPDVATRIRPRFTVEALVARNFS